MMSRNLSRRAMLAGAVLIAGSVGRGSPTPVFPIRITHSRGELVLAAPPKRIVAVGYSDVAVATALGVPLVGAISYGAGPDGHNFPWVQPALSAEIASIPAGRVDLELLRELEPDLILAATAYHSYAEHYEKLAGIAPTLVSIRRNLRDPYDQMTRLIARLTGRPPDVADALVADAEVAIAAFAARHAGWRGRTIAYAQVTSNSFHPIVDDTALALDLFRRIGLRPMTGKAKTFDCNGSHIRPLTDLRSIAGADLALLAPIGKQASVRDLVSSLPGAVSFPVVAHGRAHLVDTHLYDALVAPNPVNIPFILARLDTVLAATPRS